MTRSQPHVRRGHLGRFRLDGLPANVRLRARELTRLREALATTLNRDEKAHLVGVSSSVRHLVIFADSSAWCTRLRYRAPQFEAVAQKLTGIRPQVIFKVQLPIFREHIPARRPLSKEVIKSLESAAKSIDDEALARSLRRLAGHGSRDAG